MYMSMYMHMYVYAYVYACVYVYVYVYVYAYVCVCVYESKDDARISMRWMIDVVVLGRIEIHGKHPQTEGKGTLRCTKYSDGTCTA